MDFKSARHDLACLEAYVGKPRARRSSKRNISLMMDPLTFSNLMLKTIAIYHAWGYPPVAEILLI